MYDKNYEEFQNALHKHAVSGSYEELQNCRSSFQQVSIDYVYQVRACVLFITDFALTYAASRQLKAFSSF